MIRINDSKIRKAKSLHLKLLRKKVVRLAKTRISSVPLTSFLVKNIDALLIGEPVDLLRISDEFNALVLFPIRTWIIKNEIEKVFSYTNFIRHKKEYNAYDLAANLDLRVCSYCNRQYTLTVKKRGPITRPQFDHFYPKSEYPLLALSFYNLIPSCSICNSTLKGTWDPRKKPLPHPYFDDLGKDVSYSFKPLDTAATIGASKNMEVLLKTSNGCDPSKAKMIDNAKDVFKLSEIYSGHAEEVQDLIRIKHLYGTDYLNLLASSIQYKGLNTSSSELYRLAFATYYDTADFHKRPMSKLKKDILKELELI